MSFSAKWDHTQDDVRLTVKANTVNFIVYINWVAETIREKKVHHQIAFIGWDTWDRDGEPIPIAASFQLDPGTIPPPGQGNPMGPFFSSNSGEAGYRNIGLWQLAGAMSFPQGGNPSVGTPSSLVGSVNAMKVTFTFDGKAETLDIGSNWLTKGATMLVLVVIVLVVVALVAWWLAA